MESAPIPAAQYLRMSTERQEYSLDNQAAAICEFASLHGFNIIKTYSDAGRSGIVLKTRPALQRLLADVVSGWTTYRAVLVYDVSRWGRFQDVDEAGHYEFLCKRAGIPVIYCAELFANDGSMPASIVKSLKRVMAAEYSRELSVKSYAGQKRIVELGFRVGAPAGYGLRRMAVSADGRRRRVLEPGEHKGRPTDRIILVPGPKKEVAVIRRMYEMALHMRFGEIRKVLNAQGVPYLNGRKWTWFGVADVLTNPKYCGCVAWNRTTQKLRSKVRQVPPAEWIIKPGAFAPIINRETFDSVQRAHRNRNGRKSNEEILGRIKQSVEKTGYLSSDTLARMRGILAPSRCKVRFGSLRKIYELVNYQPTSRQLRCSEHCDRTRKLRRALLSQIARMFPGEVRRVPIVGNKREGLQLRNGTVVSVMLCNYFHTPKLRQERWWLIPKHAELGLPTLVCLLNANFDGYRGFYLFPRMDKPRTYQIRGESDPWLESGRRISGLGEFYSAAIDMIGSPRPFR